MLDLVDVHHTGLTVSDLDDAIAWYGEHLGMTKLEGRWAVPEHGLEIAYLCSGNGVRVELFQNTNADKLPAVGRDHLAFTVADMAAEIAKLEAAGVEVTIPPTHVDAARLTYAFFADPDGNKLELVQPD